jgi:hypothetical protein
MGRASSGILAPQCMRRYPSWLPALADTTAIEASALTVAGQWRSFTAFPSILAITVVRYAARYGSSGDGMKQTFMPSIVINVARREVKAIMRLFP